MYTYSCPTWMIPMPAAKHILHNTADPAVIPTQI